MSVTGTIWKLNGGLVDKMILKWRKRMNMIYRNSQGDSKLHMCVYVCDCVCICVCAAFTAYSSVTMDRIMMNLGRNFGTIDSFKFS